MTNADYAKALRQAHAHIQLLLRLPLREMLHAIAHAEAVGPMVDPTLYREKMDDLQVDKRVIEALYKATTQLARDVPEYAERTKGIDGFVAAAVLWTYAQEDR